MTQQEQDLESLVALALYGSTRRAGKVVAASHETVRERAQRAALRLLPTLPDTAPVRSCLDTCQDLAEPQDEQAVNAV